jgi:hypothetical protein
MAFWPFFFQFKPFLNHGLIYLVHHVTAPAKHNGFIYAKIYGGFEKIQSSVSFVV